MNRFQIKGLVAAAHTPFNADGTLHPSVVKKQAAHFANCDIKTVFICGTTGEAPSLTVGERQTLAKRWFDVAPAQKLQIVVHVGSNSLEDAKVLAGQAENLGAAAIAAFAPSYFKPEDVGQLV